MHERRPIADYALLGDTRTAALVASDGAIDWMCVPHFDGDPLFGRLVGGPDAGTFRVGPAGATGPPSRRYVGDTAVVETVWSVDGARLTLTDGMVAEVAGHLRPATFLVRRVVADGGPVAVTIELDPRLGERHARPRWRRRGASVVCSWGALATALDVTPAAAIEPGKAVTVTVAPGEPLTLVLAVAHREPLVHVPPDDAWDDLRRDVARWQRWADAVDGELPARDAVVRSLLTLRLLTYSPSGAPVAAPTTSLPEVPGGSRNWDYRFAWPRDASIGVAAFLGVGKREEALGFLAWLRHASRLEHPRLPVLLTLHGKRSPPERALAGWPGYAGSAPVRVGNGAAGQHQLDGYGWVVDAAWLLTQHGHRLDAETWRFVAGFADRVAASWRDPDAGIWELRDEPRHHVHSKVMGWLCLDRALRIAARRGTRRRRTPAWARERDAIAREVLERGVDPRTGVYTRRYGSAELDAALLLLPVIGIEPPRSARVVRTVDAIGRLLDAGGPLLYRYPPGRDGLPGAEGAFLPCAFWMVQALALTGRVDEAEARLAALVDLASPLGLYAEELDPATGEHLGNFPQALTHAALVQAALAIRDARRAESTLRGASEGPDASLGSASAPPEASLRNASGQAVEVEDEDERRTR